MKNKSKDTGSYPVLVVPGWGAPPFHTEWMARHFENEGFEAVRLEFPCMGMGDIRGSTELLARDVENTIELTGAPRVNLVGYSLGGLICRVYLQEMEGWRNVGRAAFVGAPQQGVYTGYPASFTRGGRQVRRGSGFMRELNEGDCGCGERRCLSLYLARDGIIVPAESARLQCGYNIRMTWPVFHWGIVFNKSVIHTAAGFLRGELPPEAVPGGQDNRGSLENKVDTGQ